MATQRLDPRGAIRSNNLPAAEIAARAATPPRTGFPAPVRHQLVGR